MTAGVSSIHFLKLVEQHYDVGLWSCDIKSGVYSPSVGIFRILSIEPTTPFSLSQLIDMMHPDDRALNDDLWPAIRGGIPSNRVFRIIRHDRTVRWVESRIDVIVDGHGKPARALGMLVDVTHQHELRRVLEDCQDRYAVVMRSVASMEWRADQDGQIYVPSSWTTLTGQTEQEALHNGWLRALHPDDRIRAKLAWRMALEGQTCFSVSFRLLSTTGQYGWFHVRAAPVPRRDQSRPEWVGMLLAHESFQIPPEVDQDVADPINAQQIRAARAILNWTLEDLSTASGISVSSIRRIEGDGQHVTRKSSLTSIRDAFEQHGLEFVTSKTGRISISLDMK